MTADAAKTATYQSGIRPDYQPLHTLLPLDKPLSLFIDTCDMCNFRCEFCFQSRIDYKGRVMTPELFSKIADDLEAWISQDKTRQDVFKMVHLSAHGEPLLNRDLPDFIRRLKSDRTAEYTKITTNASLLDEGTSKALIDAGLDIISISIYGLDDAFYKKFTGRDVSFDAIYKNVERFYRLADDGAACNVHVKIAGNYFTQREREYFLEKFGSISTSIHIDTAVNVWPGLDTVDERSAPGGHVYGMGFDERQFICPMPFYQMFVNSAGLVSVCCADSGSEKVMVAGDVRTQSLRDIWNGDYYRRIRRDLLERRTDDRLCRICKAAVRTATADIAPYRDELLNVY